jgi:hypothetical protein
MGKIMGGIELKNCNYKKTEFIVILIFASLMLFIFMPTVSAVYIIANPNDPYTDRCVFDAAPGESVLYLNDYQGNGEMRGTLVDTDMTIGQYIREQYPDVWDLLSTADQDLYNTRWAVYEIGASEPILPDKVKELLAAEQTSTGFSSYYRTNNFALSGFSSSQLSGIASRFTTAQQTKVLPSYSSDSNVIVAAGYFSRGESSSKWNFNATLVASGDMYESSGTTVHKDSIVALPRKYRVEFSCFC